MRVEEGGNCLHMSKLFPRDRPEFSVDWDKVVTERNVAPKPDRIKLVTHAIAPTLPPKAIYEEWAAEGTLGQHGVVVFPYMRLNGYVKYGPLQIHEAVPLIMLQQPLAYLFEHSLRWWEVHATDGTIYSLLPNERIQINALKDLRLVELVVVGEFALRVKGKELVTPLGIVAGRQEMR